MTTDRIEKQALLKAPIDRVWRAIADSAEFGTWFGMKVDGPFVQGETLNATIVPTTVNAAVAEGQKAYEGTPFVLIIERVEPEKVFAFRWHPYAIENSTDYTAEPTTLVSFVLEQKEDGVLLTVSESGFDQISLDRRANAFSANEQGWSIQMTLIAAYLAKSP